MTICLRPSRFIRLVVSATHISSGHQTITQSGGDLVGATMSSKTMPLTASISGWKPISETDAEQFRTRVAEMMALTRTASVDLHLDHSIADLQRHMELASEQIPHSTKHMRKIATLGKPPEHIDAENASKAAEPGHHKRQCRTDEGKLRRKFKTHQLLHGTPKSRAPISALNCDGNISENRAEWKLELQRFCEGKYHGRHPAGARSF